VTRALRHGDYAGFITRMVAFILDRLIIAVSLAGAAVFFHFLMQTFKLSQVLDLWNVSLETTAAIYGAVTFIFSLVYDVGGWTLAGQTPGKRIMGLLVVRTNGKRVKLGAALLRWLGYWLSGILFLGFLWVLVDNRRQGFHDKLARTFVVYSRPEAIGIAASTPIRNRLKGLRQQ
jgi:uncharacterized RDD family membrane protein YckC